MVAEYLVISVSAAIIIFELHQNLKQRKIQNYYSRVLEIERFSYNLMETDQALVTAKGFISYDNLEEYEKIQFEGQISQRIRNWTRGYMLASQSSIDSAELLRKKIQTDAKYFFSKPSVLKAFYSMQSKGNNPNNPTLSEIFDDAGLLIEVKY